MADAAEEEVAEEIDGGEGEEGGGQKKGKKKLLIIILAVLLLLGAGAGVFLSGILGGGEPPPEEAEEVLEEEAPPPDPVRTVFFDLPDMIVNLNSSARKSTFLKISISLELTNASDIERIEEVMPRIVDQFQGYLREMRLEDLKGSAGLYRLREELLRRVNLAVRPIRVREVLFKEMLVQ